MKYTLLIQGMLLVGAMFCAAPVSATSPDCCLPIAAAALTEPMYFEFDTFLCCCGPAPEDCTTHLSTGSPVSARYTAYTYIYTCGYGDECEEPDSGAVPCGEVGPGTHLEWDGFIAGDFICEVGCEDPCFPEPPSQSFDVLDYFCDCATLDCEEA